MAGNLGELIQMISGLSQIQHQKQQLDLTAQQLHQQAQQFASADNAAKFRTAIEQISKANVATRGGMQSLIDSLAPEYRATAQAMLQNAPVDPGTIKAGDIQAGHNAAQAAGTLGPVQQEALNVNDTGMNAGQIGTSAVTGAIAGQALPQVTPEMGAGFAQRDATGQTQFQAAVDRAAQQQGLSARAAQLQYAGAPTDYQSGQLAIGRSGAGLGWAQLQQQGEQFGANFGLDSMLKTAESMKASGKILTPELMIQLRAQKESIVKAMQDPQASPGGIQVGTYDLNRINQILGDPMVSPDGAPGTMLAPTNAGAFSRFMNQNLTNHTLSIPGAGTAATAWPAPGGNLGH